MRALKAMSASISVALLATEFRLMLLVERWRCRCCATGADIPLCVGARSGAESRIDNAPARNTGEGGQVHFNAAGTTRQTTSERSDRSNLQVQHRAVAMPTVIPGRAQSGAALQAGCIF